MKRPNEVAYEYIKSRILDGTYHPAQRMLEVHLADEIGVSRNTVKKALLRLAQEQLVVIENNKGASVRSLDTDEVTQYMEIREELEAIIVRQAALNIDEKAVEELEKVYEKMQVLCRKEDFDIYSKYNTQFHTIIYRASRKPIITSYCLNIKTQLSRFQFRTMLVPERSIQSLEEHNEILKAMKQRNPDDAEKAIRAHMSNLLNTILKYKKLFF